MAIMRTAKLSHGSLKRLAATPSALLAYCGLRATLRRSRCFDPSGDCRLLCILPPGYRLEDYTVAAEFVFNNDVLDQESIHRISVHTSRPAKGRIADCTAYDLGTTALIIAEHAARIPDEIRLAVDEIVTLSPATAFQVNLVRRATKRPRLPDDVVERLAARPYRLIVAALGRCSITTDDLDKIASVHEETDARSALQELPGFDKPKEWATELVQDVTLWREGSLQWGAVSRGALLSGPSGCGKTTFAGALAKTLGFELISTTVGIWQAAGHLDDTLRAMRQPFMEAAEADGAVLFMDELDGIGDRGKLSGEHKEYWRVVVNELLSLTSALPDGVVLLGATNNPEAIDPALLRSGRIEEHFALTLPDRDTRAEILSYHLARTVDAAGLRDVASDLDGCSGADLELLARKALRRARTHSRGVDLSDVLASLPIRRRFTEFERFRLAVHECGHAVAALRFAYADTATVSIRETFDPSKNDYQGGSTRYQALEDWLPTEGSIRCRIATALGGMAAEQIALGLRSIGSGGGKGTDVELATVLARRLVTSYGLGEVPVYIRDLGDIDCQTPLPQDVEVEVRRILLQQYERVVGVLAEERSTIIDFANKLVERGVIEIRVRDLPADNSLSSVP